MAKENPNFNDALTQEILKGMEESSFERSYSGEYQGSKIQEKTYSSLEKQDVMFQQYIAKNFGSYSNYLQQKKIQTSVTIFDPTVHYMMDVTINTEDETYKSDHISPDQLIMEALSGVCTIIFMDSNNAVRRINGTLERSYMPTKEFQTRASFFSPMPGDRIGIWDLNEQSWKSFYMNKALRFVRDDTIGLE
jgi:hypothetical protein